MLYAYPRLGRTGLANMLFPWARAEVFARDHVCPVIAPDWTHWGRIGPWLRGERDKRYYLNCFTSDGYVRGAARAWILATHRRLPETQFAQRAPLTEAAVVEFQGIDSLFAGLEPEAAWLRERLLRIVHPRLRAEAGNRWPGKPAFIALHIRRGDFREWTAGEITNNTRLPLEWYSAAIHFAREQFGPLPAYVFTDGTPGEVASITALPDVSLAEAAPAVVHLLAIANATCIVTSASSFSMWSAYLSQGSAIWFPGVCPCPRQENAPNLVMGFGIA